ncbi:MAG: eukaryotic-like serine/threonine-protein kinase [Acidobacteriota bacterium]|jgi:formylglycine-generating enzyme required for sulfatase activity/tRNA A-37 threonylcarbamoyl transferase component Bud32|nr:eukaryotic-like serine/threonine-protein kinase [Acidobacteriota bacterium]
MINRFVQDYRLTNFIAYGVGSEIYKATHAEREGSAYRVKRIPRQKVDRNAFFDGFVTLAQQLAHLDDPKVLRLYEILFDDEAAYLVSESISGQPVALLVEPKGIFALPHAVGLFKQAAEAVAAAHAAGTLHGSPTARSVLYAVEKYVKVEDFGLYPLLSQLGLSDHIVPPGSLAPELAEGAPASVQSDVYTLGTLLVHLLTGQCPKPAAETAEGSAGEVVDQLRALRTDLPNRLLELVAHATARDPEQRFSSVVALADLAADRSNALVGTGLSFAPGGPAAPRGLIQLGGGVRKPRLPGDPASGTESEAEELRPWGDLPEMVLIPAGSFRMGSDRRRNESPVHEVELPAFEIAATPTTNRQYARYCAETGAPRPKDPPAWGAYFTDCPDHPVINVRYADAVAFCKWLSASQGGVYRPPTEAEWEKAARGGLEGKIYPWGDDSPDGRAQFGGRAFAWEIVMQEPQSRRVGCFEPNGYGLYDLSGNVWEWCSDWYLPYDQPQPHAGVFRVGRGGSWSVEEDCIRCSFRMSLFHTTSDFFIGFRCVREVA